MSTQTTDAETIRRVAEARSHLARGDIVTAAAILRGLADSVNGQSAMTVAELLLAARHLDEATDLAVRIAGEPGDVWPWVNQFAGHMRARGLIDASTRALEAFIATSPDQSIERLHADMALALGLPAAYRDSRALDTARRRYREQLEALVTKYRPQTLRDLGARADDFARSNFHLAYQGGDDREAQSSYGNWLADSLTALADSPPVVRSHPPRPTIACISSKWHECTIGWYFAAWVEHLSRSWNVTLVHTAGARRDALTQRLAAACHEEVMLLPSVDAAAIQIRALAPDIVLYPELGTDGFTFALAAQRLAPVQVCAWGHPVTTGLPTIDAYFSCDAMEPDDAATHYRERLIRLPGIGTRYASPPLPPEPSARHARLPVGHPLYLVPQAIFKWHTDTDRQLVEIVRRDPSARFVLFELRPPSPAGLVNERLLRALGEITTKPHEHLIWMPECSRDDYLRINQACDVMVDTPHWSGGNATLDALLCGLPVVTLPGRFMRGRQSTGMLRLLGCEELIARSAEDVAEIAVALAHDKARRDALSAKIRARLSSVTQSDEALIVMEASLHTLFERRDN